MAPTSIYDIPSELLHLILNFALPPIPLFSLSANDSEKLSAQDDLVEARTRVLLTCKHWARSLGPRRIYIAIGVEALEKLRADLETGKVNGLAIASLRLETETVGREDYAVLGDDFYEIGESTRRLDVLSQVLVLCPETRHLQIFARFGSCRMTSLCHAFSQLTKLKTLEIMEIVEWIELTSLLVNIPHLHRIYFQRLYPTVPNFPTPPLCTTLTCLALVIVFLPSDFHFLQQLICISRNSLDSFAVQEYHFEVPEAYDILNQLLAPVCHRLKTLSCGRAFHLPSNNVTDLNTALLDSTLLTLPQIESLSLPHKSFHSLFFMHSCRALTHVSLEYKDFELHGSRIGSWTFEELAHELTLRNDWELLLVIEVRMPSMLKSLMDGAEKRKDLDESTPIYNALERCRNKEIWFVWTDEVQSDVFDIESIESSRELKYVGSQV